MRRSCAGCAPAGAIIVAKTNMSEFAYTGIGANPHFGTPGNPADRKRVPGGSSSGAVVSAADGMCEIAIGSDTGSSCRIPAAICGIVGYKPSRQRIPTDGAFPPVIQHRFNRPHCAHGGSLCQGRCRHGRLKISRSSSSRSWPSLRIGIVQGTPLERSRRDRVEAFRRGGRSDCAKPVRVCLKKNSHCLLIWLTSTSKGGVLLAEAFAVHAS